MLHKKDHILKLKGAITFGTAFLAVGCFGASVQAVVIMPGQTLNTNGEAAPAFGAPLDNTGEVPFEATDIFNNEVFAGDLDTTVYADPTTGDLDFVYQFSNTFDGDSILHFSASSFAGFTTDADYVTGTGTDPADAPTSVTRNPDTGGSTLDYSFPSGVAYGTDSAELIVKTNAPISAFTQSGTASFQDGGSVSITAPGTVPEPTTAAIAGFALVSLGLRRRAASR